MKVMKLYVMFALISSAAFGQNGKLFKAIKGTDTLYVCGTIHLIPKAKLNDQKEVVQALNASDTAYFEVLSDQYKTQQLLMPYLKGDSTSLRSYLDSAEIESFSAFFRANMGSTKFLDFPPLINFFMVMQTLGTQDSVMPMDFFYMKLAKGMRLPIAELESIEYQFELIEKIPGKELLKAIKEFVLNNEEQEAMYQELLDAYVNTNHQALMEVMESDSSAELFNNAIFIDRRNETMLTHLLQPKQGKTNIYFIGIGHLIGEEGILSGLRKAGYSIQKID